MRRSAQGFTLVEVLIALAVVSIALVAFVSAGAQNAGYATYIHQRTVAQMIAQNRLVEYQVARDWPDTGKREGDVDMAAAKWHWEAAIENTADDEVRRVDVRVYSVDPDTNQPDKNSTMLLSGFLSQHEKQKNNDADAATNADDGS